MIPGEKMYLQKKNERKLEMVMWRVNIKDYYSLISFKIY